MNPCLHAAVEGDGARQVVDTPPDFVVDLLAARRGAAAGVRVAEKPGRVVKGFSLSSLVNVVSPPLEFWNWNSS